ncbi:probable glutamate receptor [Protopterus annectens]|uniref:probable glutamate receptor n=1 Tax=Protopterus annectens TaxID=7888 RepID=UPI001CFAB19B|nr:probable glutamate receptor [Protopterus annectens]XP_043918922.1 probable glutamate receptor [Protopterus annectens]XP_043918923.1 probable glutamate receptor [Protopterus annectens]XP_043918924.1 probable glutamate receptor [Protopterus annectens]
METTFTLLFCLSILMTAIELGKAGNEDRISLYRQIHSHERAKRQAGNHLTVTTILQEPFTMLEGSKFEGYCMDLLAELSKKLGFTYNVSLVKDGRYGQLDQENNWNGMIGEVIRKEADLAVAPLTITAVREKAILFTKPYIQTGIGILVRRDAIPEDIGLFRFLNPFSKEIWIGALAAFLVTCLCLFLVARVSPYESQEEETGLTLLNSLWYGTGAFTLQGVDPQPKALSTRIIAVVWWLFTIVLVTAYIASFAALLNTKTQQPSIQTFDDLLKQKTLAFETLRESSTYNFFKTSKRPTYRMIYEYMDKRKESVLVSTFDEGVKRVQESNYAFIGESVSLDLVAAKHCNLMRVNEVIGARGYGLVAANDSKIIRSLSVAILEMGETGELSYLKEKWWDSKCVTEETGGWTPLEPKPLGGIFIILAVGLVIGLIVAVVEMVLKSRHQKKSCCNVFSEELTRQFKGEEVEKPTENAEAEKP